MLTVLMSSVLLLGGTAATTAGAVLFHDPLDGSAPVSAWRTPPSTFVDLPDGGRAVRFQRDTTWSNAGQPWAGDETWSDYRIELEVQPEKMWGGVDFHVRNDGTGGCEVTVIQVEGGLVVEASGLWHLASAWKLWPVGQRAIPHEPGTWVRLRLDVGRDVVNVFANDDPQAFATFRDLPFSRGGIRLAAYAGSTLFRDLRVSALPEGSVVPALDEDPWASARDAAFIPSWKVTPRQEPGIAGTGDPAGAIAGISWLAGPMDGRGVVNLTSFVGPEAKPGVVLARTSITSETPGPRRAWVTYTDNFSLWCNGKLIFEGPPRQWFHPDREKNGNSRLIPDQYQVVLPLGGGKNEILVRSEVTEATFGWAFWMRVDPPGSESR